MFKPVFHSLVAALLLVAAGMGKSEKQSAFNKAELETYLRHLWVIPQTLGVSIGDPKPSDVPGLDEIRVTITQGQASQVVLLYATKDGSEILQGNAYDVNFNPFKKDLDKLKTQFQPRPRPSPAAACSTRIPHPSGITSTGSTDTRRPSPPIT